MTTNPYHLPAVYMVAGILSKATRLINAAMQKREPILYHGCKAPINTRERSQAQARRKR